MDYIYDSAIRSDLLIETLKIYKENGFFPEFFSQEGKGKTYYVIHPLLKHIAMLKREVN